LYFYDVKIQTNFKQNLVEEYAEESQIFKNIYIFWILFGPGRTRPAHFGLGQTCLAQWTVEHSPLFTCYVNSGEWINSLSTVHAEQWRWCSEEEEEEKEKGRGVDLRWLRGCAAGGCWPENSLDGGWPFFFFSAFFSSALFSSVSVFSVFLLLFLTVQACYQWRGGWWQLAVALGWRWWRLCGLQPVVLPPFSPSLFSLPRLGNGVGGAAAVLLVRVCCLCQQRPPLFAVVVLLIAHGAGGNRGTGGAAWPVVLLPFSALSFISGLLCSFYLSSKSSSPPPVCFPSLFGSVSFLSITALLLSSSPFSSFFLMFCPSFTPLKNKLSPLFSVLPPLFFVLPSFSKILPPLNLSLTSLLLQIFCHHQFVLLPFYL